MTTPTQRTPGGTRAAVVRRTPNSVAPRRSNSAAFQTATQMPSFIRQAHNSDLRRLITTAFRLDCPLAAQCLLAGKLPDAESAVIDGPGGTVVAVFQWMWRILRSKESVTLSSSSPTESVVQAWKMSLQGLAEVQSSFMLPIESVTSPLQDATVKAKCRVQLTSSSIAEAIVRMKAADLLWISQRELKVLEARDSVWRKVPCAMQSTLKWLLSRDADVTGSFVCCYFVLDDALQWVLKRLEFEKAGGVNSSGCVDYLKGARVGREEEFVLTDESSVVKCALGKFAEIRSYGIPESALEELVSARLVSKFGCLRVDELMFVPIGSTSVSYFIKHQLLGGKTGKGALRAKTQTLKGRT